MECRSSVNWGVDRVSIKYWSVDDRRSINQGYWLTLDCKCLLLVLMIYVEIRFWQIFIPFIFSAMFCYSYSIKELENLSLRACWSWQWKIQLTVKLNVKLAVMLKVCACLAAYPNLEKVIHTIMYICTLYLTEPCWLETREHSFGRRYFKEILHLALELSILTLIITKI